MQYTIKFYFLSGSGYALLDAKHDHTSFWSPEKRTIARSGIHRLLSFYRNLSCGFCFGRQRRSVCGSQRHLHIKKKKEETHEKHGNFHISEGTEP